jgi:hypothetical protein
MSCATSWYTSGRARDDLLYRDIEALRPEQLVEALCLAEALIASEAAVEDPHPPLLVDLDPDLPQGATPLTKILSWIF